MPEPRAVGPISELPPGERRVIDIDDRQIVVLNVAGTYHALENVCPHRGGPVGEGNLDGNVITCPWHGWSFDLTTGQNTMNPAAVVKTFPVHVDGDQIVVDI